MLKGFNDLRTKFPDVAAEANGWDPETVLPGSNKKLPWKCKPCGKEWTTTPNKRTQENATGCPECAKKKMGGKKNTIEQMREVAKEVEDAYPKNMMETTLSCCGSAPKDINRGRQLPLT